MLLRLPKAALSLVHFACTPCLRSLPALFGNKEAASAQGVCQVSRCLVDVDQ